jgi:hypothetical protein
MAIQVTKSQFCPFFHGGKCFIVPSLFPFLASFVLKFFAIAQVDVNSQRCSPFGFRSLDRHRRHVVVNYFLLLGLRNVGSIDTFQANEPSQVRPATMERDPEFPEAGLDSCQFPRELIGRFWKFWMAQ